MENLKFSSIKAKIFFIISMALAMSSCDVEEKDIVTLESGDTFEIKKGHSLKAGDNVQVGTWQRFLDKNQNDNCDPGEGKFQHKELNLDGSIKGDVKRVLENLQDELVRNENDVVGEVEEKK